MSLKGTAKQTLAYLEAGGYDHPEGRRVEFGAELAAAVAGTQLLTPAQLAALLERPGAEPRAPARLEVTPERTQAAARRLVVDEGVEDLVLLNFASAKNAGGGFINGAKAQEEDLARASGLYPCLRAAPGYYTANRAEEVGMLYTDHMIWSPRVPFFRVRNRSLLDHCFLASVITAPAPNAGVHLRREGSPEALSSCLRQRAGYVLALAQAKGHRNLLLGAWGCGVFRNQPAAVADAFASWLEHPRFRGSFERVCFAILDKPGHTRAAFEARLLA